MRKKILFFANTDWYLYNFSLPLAEALRREGMEVVMISPPGSYGSRLLAAGFRWLPLPMNRRSLNPWTEIKLLIHLARLYARERPVLVHHLTTKCIIYGSLAARLVGIGARVNEVTGMGYVLSSNSLRARLLRPGVKGLMKLALGGDCCGQLMIVQNPNDRDACIRAGLTAAERIRLIPGCGVNTKRFAPHLSLTVAKTDAIGREMIPLLRVLVAARLLWEKGIGEYVQAAKILKDAGLPVQCFLASSPDPGNPASISEKQLAVWKQQGTITLLGYVDNIERLLPQMDVVVLPTTSYGEGVPRSLLEAAAYGLPIIATDVSGCREIVMHGVNGLLVPPRDAVALAAAIQYLLDHPEERQRMGAAGRARVLAEFDECIVFPKIMEVYRELVAV